MPKKQSAFVLRSLSKHPHVSAATAQRMADAWDDAMETVLADTYPPDMCVILLERVLPMLNPKRRAAWKRQWKRNLAEAERK